MRRALVTAAAATTIVAAGTGASGSVSPAADAHAPDRERATVRSYTPKDVCGESYFVVDDAGGVGGKAKRPVTLASSGEIYGYVYLLYNRNTGRNCVATIKTRYEGVRTWTGAFLTIRGAESPQADTGRFESFAGPVKKKAAGHCVQYWGFVEDDRGRRAQGGRDSWGNCGSRVRG